MLTFVRSRVITKFEFSSTSTYRTRPNCVLQHVALVQQLAIKRCKWIGCIAVTHDDDDVFELQLQSVCEIQI
jgi:hypothetical protein